MVSVKIALNALPEKQKEVIQTLLSMIESTVKEKGCLGHHIFRDLEDENAFSLIDEWKTRKDLEQHLGSAKFGVLLGTKSLLCEPPNIQIHTVSNSERMPAVTVAEDKST